MVHDYYLHCLLKEKQGEMENKEQEQYLENVFIIPLACKKGKIRENSKNTENIRAFYPQKEDLQYLPEGSTLVKISFTLKRPYTSKDEGEFHIIDGKILENPIVRDKFTGLPIVRPSTWKGHLRFAAEKVKYNENNKKKIIKRLFGAEPGDDEPLKGRLYFFPTFFEKVDKDVITPLKRTTRTPARGPISLEIVKSESKGEFYLLYVPYPKGKDFEDKQIEEDLLFISKALELMFYVYGFSAKKTSGFGVIGGLKKRDIEIYPEDRKEIFLNLIHQT